MRSINCAAAAAPDQTRTKLQATKLCVDCLHKADDKIDPPPPETGDCSRPRCLESGDTDDVSGLVMGMAAWQQISGVLGLNCGRCPVHTVLPTPDRDSVFGKEILMVSHENKSCASYSYTIEQCEQKV